MFTPVRYKKDIINLWPHHFRERSDLSCFQLDLLPNREIKIELEQLTARSSSTR